MSGTDPFNTTVGDLCSAALRESGAIGVGQTPLTEDVNGAWERMQWMLQEWNRKRWLVYHLVTKLVISTGAFSYTVGPGGDIDYPEGQRPDKIESAFLRQFSSGSSSGMPVTDDSDQVLSNGASNVYVGGTGLPIDYPLELLQSMEDYNRIALKTLTSFPGAVFYDPAWPLGNLYLYPVAQANIYAIGITVKEVLPIAFPNLAAVVSLPPEYYAAIVYTLAMRLRPKYRIPTFPGDPLPGMAKDALNVLRGANTAIARLRLPTNLLRPGIYNIFSDQNY